MKKERRFKSTKGSKISFGSRPWASTLSSHGYLKNSLFSSYWDQSSNPNLSFSSCLDGSWRLLGVQHLKGKNQVCYNSILSRFLEVPSFGLLDIFTRYGGILLFSLEERMSSAWSLILVTRNSPQPQPKLSFPNLYLSISFRILSKFMNH
jgi:hypothetical protein